MLAQVTNGIAELAAHEYQMDMIHPDGPDYTQSKPITDSLPDSENGVEDRNFDDEVLKDYYPQTPRTQTTAQTIRVDQKPQKRQHADTKQHDDHVKKV